MRFYPFYLHLPLAWYFTSLSPHCPRLGWPLPRRRPPPPPPPPPRPPRPLSASSGGLSAAEASCNRSPEIGGIRVSRKSRMANRLENGKSIRAAHIASLVDVLRLGDVLIELLHLLVVEAAEDGGVDAANLVLEKEKYGEIGTLNDSS